jgi:hypothetical protein
MHAPPLLPLLPILLLILEVSLLGGGMKKRQLLVLGLDALGRPESLSLKASTLYLEDSVNSLPAVSMDSCLPSGVEQEP